MDRTKQMRGGDNLLIWYKNVTMTELNSLLLGYLYLSSKILFVVECWRALISTEPLSPQKCFWWSTDEWMSWLKQGLSSRHSPGGLETFGLFVHVSLGVDHESSSDQSRVSRPTKQFLRCPTSAESREKVSFESLKLKILCWTGHKKYLFFFN